MAQAKAPADKPQAMPAYPASTSRSSAGSISSEPGTYGSGGACPATLRGSIALHARGSLLSRRVVLALDLSDCDDADVWPAVRRLADARPAGVTLVVATRLGATLPVAVRVPARGRGYPPTLTMPACGVSGTR